MSLTSSQIDLEHQSSGNPEDNGRTLLRSIWTLPRSISLNNMLSYVYNWLFTTTIFRHGRRQGGRGAEGSSSDVEVGVGGALQWQAAASAVAEPNNTIVVDGGSTQVAEDLISFSLTSSMQAASGRGPPSYVSDEGDQIVSTPFIGRQVVEIWIVPTVVGVVTGLIQVAAGCQKANSDQKLLLYLCYAISLTTVILGIILFILYTTQGINNQRRDLTIRSIVAVALGSTFVDICALITFGFILVQSKPHE